jgi:hypothetical protein
MHENRLCQFYRARPPWPSLLLLTKLSFPICLGRRGTLPVLVLSTQCGQDPARAGSGSPSPLTQSLGFFQLYPHLGEVNTGFRICLLARRQTRECRGILGTGTWGAERMPEQAPQTRGRERGCCSLKFTEVGEVDAVDLWVSKRDP